MLNRLPVLRLHEQPGARHVRGDAEQQSEPLPKPWDDLSQASIADGSCNHPPGASRRRCVPQGRFYGRKEGSNT